MVEHKRDKRPVLLYASEWDTAENARKMFDAYRRVLKGKWKQMRIVTDTPGIADRIGRRWRLPGLDYRDPDFIRGRLASRCCG